MRRVIHEMHMSQVTIAYGMTETAPISFQTGRDDTLERRVSTVGRVQPHFEAKIIDRNGRIVPLGEPGQFCTRGYGVMRGYWKDPERTAEAIDEAGWMHTGDLGVMDADGYVNIVGRVKDMVIRGGENIYPREIEEFLFQHPAILAVQVVGVPDDKYGEELAACIILREGELLDEDAVRVFCKDQIAHFKIPRYIEFMQEFPMTATGKPQKFSLREHLIQKHALRVVATA
jgi:fatty-acyl-CoA synthase